MAHGARLKSRQYYLDRAEEVREQAKQAKTESMRNGFLRAADAYDDLAQAAEDLSVKSKDTKKA